MTGSPDVDRAHGGLDVGGPAVEQQVEGVVVDDVAHEVEVAGGLGVTQRLPGNVVGGIPPRGAGVDLTGAPRRLLASSIAPR